MKLRRKSEKRHEKSNAELYVKKDYPRDGSSCSGTQTAYSVEVRFNSCQGVKVVAGHSFDQRWVTLPFEKVEHGIPMGNFLNYHARYFNLMTYQCAQALRWWFHAEAEREALGDLCLESRIVKHEVEYCLKEKIVSHHEHVGGDAGDYPTCRPSTEIPQDPSKIEDK